MYEGDPQQFWQINRRNVVAQFNPRRTAGSSTTPMQKPEDCRRVDLWTHGRLFNYNQPTPWQDDISQWLIRNPHGINLGRIGILFYGKNELYLYSGRLTPKFSLGEARVVVQTCVDPTDDTIAVEVGSKLVTKGLLLVFFGFPYAIGKNKSDAPFAGVWDAVGNHTTEPTSANDWAQIKHTLDDTTYFVTAQWDKDCIFTFSTTFTSTSPRHRAASVSWIQKSSSTPTDTRAREIRGRIILSQHLLAVNYVGKEPPQESGLVNSGWYGKFHLEIYLWHSAHWGCWDKWDLLDWSTDVYSRFLGDQGYSGARWGKMSDPSGGSAPGLINSLLIWQQPHPLYFAGMEYRAKPTLKTLRKWREVVFQTAEFMSSYTFWNESTGVYGLGPPFYPVSENTKPNVTINPTFEQVYWRFGLEVARSWQERQDLAIAINTPEFKRWITFGFLSNLAWSWCVVTRYDGRPTMNYTLPLNLTIMKNTAERVWSSWNFTDCWGWGFPTLAMNTARPGDGEKAVEFLMHENFVFDVGMPASGALLAVGMIAAGWGGGGKGGGFPEGWMVRSEGFEAFM
ncbi:hypothetical protein L873DRAFT_1831616 [Choiromyces venosus 120613-1]|uniref:Six-hairpin glycosidase n=1 Tax=Choiromyces venosus 120613-1 TaxID=1336337 RepID=A0A3N4IXM3_9PEZI|nr:hypothetical protein L873DRAFT_1831616 [Choiromyces venosus 120613-1]